ncbi:polysaccharide biosynthesis/export family protein [Christiangramia aquimixticola]|uniref:polysaccharide biosynthesis/export family protein n=1 Tax=Christiangramia aquimixticola TaxID=1697558 RepID=UPI003AA9518C
MIKKLYFVLLLVSVCSCSTKKDVVYFYEGRENIEASSILNYEPKIEKDDILRINVSSSSINEEIVKPFQMKQQGQNNGGGSSRSSALINGYLVNPNGSIKFPVLGEVAVSGLTRIEVEKKLEQMMTVYIKDPIVDVRILNFSITVLGEVRSPGRVQVDEGNISLPELLAMAGDITYNGKRENITIIREENGIRKIGYIDMTKSNLFDSPFYYLKQNDIVYVQPTYRTVKSAGFFSSYQGIISVGTTIVSLYLLIRSL